ncbi:MAG: HD domain-containing protein [Rhodospirillales bacterium]
MTRHLTPDNVVSWIAELFEVGGGREYLGEPVTQAEHMLQGAALAESSGQSDEIVAAALLHDVGHLVDPDDRFSMDDTEDRHHENLGAEALAPFFPPVVVECVRHHVAAKRYLCATNPRYFDRLSEASVHSLKLQGGPMSDDEVELFQRNPYVREIVQIRHLDDAGKQVGADTPGFAHYAPLLQRLVDAHCGKAA